MNNSYMSATSSLKANRARVELLKDLHRPLEEHWATTKAHGLDAMGSDYIYKHHITRLEGIYNAHDAIHIDNSEPKGVANVSPMSQLYGTDGMLRGGQEDHINLKREHNWDTYHTTTERMNPCVERKSTLHDNAATDPQPHHLARSSRSVASRADQARAGGRYNEGFGPAPSTHGGRSPSYRRDRANSRERSASPLAIQPSPSHRQVHHHDADERTKSSPRTEWKLKQEQSEYMRRQQTMEQQKSEYQSQQQHNLNDFHRQQHLPNAPQDPLHVSRENDSRHRCRESVNMSEDELFLTGMYQLKPAQSHVYRQFVSMLLEHDTTDQLRILEDAFKDAQVESLLSNFSGT